MSEVQGPLQPMTGSCAKLICTLESQKYKLT